MKKYSQIKSKLETFFVIIIASVLVIHASASYGSHGEQVEIFQCGSLGDLTLTTLLESPALELRNTAKAYLFISERNLSYTGVIHNFRVEMTELLQSLQVKILEDLMRQPREVLSR